MIHASAEAIEFLTSLASLRHLPLYANVRSTPFALSLLDDRGRPEADLLQPPLQLAARLAAIGKDIQQLSYLPRNSTLT
jgi:hypothetical protein